MDNYFEILIELLKDLYPVIFIPICLSLLFSMLGAVRRVFIGSFSFGKSKSNDDELPKSIPFEPWEEPKKVKHNRINEFGEREYDYSQNNYECEGCK